MLKWILQAIKQQKKFLIQRVFRLVNKTVKTNPLIDQQEVSCCLANESAFSCGFTGCSPETGEPQIQQDIQ